jgi:hypothetical protein
MVRVQGVLRNLDKQEIIAKIDEVHFSGKLNDPRIQHCQPKKMLAHYRCCVI